MSRNAKFKQVPPVPITDTPAVGEFLTAVKQILETYQGNVGDAYGLDRVVRFRDIAALSPIQFSTKRSSFTSRITTISGNVIRLGKIESNDSDTFFDLDNDKLVFNGKINYASLMPGIFMGRDSDGTYKFNMGYATNTEIKFDGTNVYLGKWTITPNGIGDNLTENDSKIFLDKTNTLIRVGPSSAYLSLDGANVRVSSSNYSSGAMGSGFLLSSDLLEVGNIACRGIFRTAVFQKDVLSVVGGSVVVLDADVLDADMTAADNSTLTIEGNSTFSVGDILRIKDGTNDEWFTVTDAGSAPTYSVERDKAGNYTSGNNPAWTKGASVVNYMQTGDGGVLMTASLQDSPYLSVFSHTGSPWTSISTHLRLGNLNGFLGYASDLYGIAIGESNKYLKYDSTNGLRIRGDITVSGSHGSVKIYDNLASEIVRLGNLNGFLGYSSDAYGIGIGNSNQYIKYDPDGDLRIRGDISVVGGYGSVKIYDATPTEVARMGNLNGFLGYATDHYGFASGGTFQYIKYDTTDGLQVQGNISVTGGHGVISIYDSNPTEIFRLGDLDGFLGYSSTTYGIAIGSSSKYLKYDETNGLRIKSLTIYDSSDNVVMASGGAVWDYITGSGKPSDNADVTDYTDTRVANALLADDVLTISNPIGATYSGGNNDTGAIKITLPQSWTATMMRFEVDVYLYDSAKNFKLIVGGYNHSTSSTWVNYFAQILGNTTSDNRVRFGHDGTKCCIVIGETTSEWDYPKISVKNFQAGYQHYTVDEWDDGWDIDVITSTSGITFTGDLSDNLVDANTIKDQGTLALLDAVTWGTHITNQPADADLLNSYVSIAANGALSGAGGGQVTITGINGYAQGDVNGLLDGKINCYYQDAEPASGMDADDLWVDTNDENKVYIYTGSAWQAVSTQDAVQALADAAAAQSTADGKIVSYYQTSEPSGGSIGDFWVDTDNGNKLYRHSGSAWIEIQDDDIATAINSAQTAQTTADGKAIVYYQAGTPTGMSEGDIWVDTDDDNKTYVYSGSAWVATSNTDALQALADAAAAQSTADGKIVAYYQDAQPSGGSEGDIWFDTNDGNKIYVYTSGAWVESQDTDIADAINQAQTAQSTADGKAVVYYQTGQPSGASAGDLWVDTDDENKVYTYSGSSWVVTSNTDAVQAIQDAASAQDTADGKRTVFVATPTPPYDLGDLWKYDADTLYICSTAKAQGESYSAGDWARVADKTSENTSADTTAVNGTAAATIATAVGNYNDSNDMNDATVVAPTVTHDADAVDHIINDDGSADISFEWNWGGTEADIDGFQVYIYSSTSSSSYTMGTTDSAETVYTIPANRRAFIIQGCPANRYYTFGVRAYRVVNTNVNSNGILVSSIAQPGYTDDDPYRPVATVAFDGAITGTIAGASDVGDMALIDQITVGNASTYIENVAIDTAQIATAAVETLKINGNAVTVPVGADSTTDYPSPTEDTMCSIDIDSDGGDIITIATSTVKVSSTSSSSGGYASLRLFLYKDGTGSGDKLLTTEFYISVEADEDKYASEHIMYFDDGPTDGTHTYYLRGEYTGVSRTTTDVQKNSMLALGCKR